MTLSCEIAFLFWLAAVGILPVFSAVVGNKESLSKDLVNKDSTGKDLAKEDLDNVEYGKDLWLDDFDTGVPAQRRRYDVDHDVMMQADSPPFSDEDRGSDVQALVSKQQTLEVTRPECPPPPSTRPPYLCEAATCDSDKVCKGRGLMCCYNGCKYTCMVSLPPKSYIDWQGQPRRRLPSGASWLVQGNDERTEVDWCSTTEVYYEDEEPLLCPHGHICHIDDLGDPHKGIPNRGRCVAEHSQAPEELKRSYRIVTGEGQGAQCNIKNVTYDNGSTFLYEKHVCNCIDGSVLCKVGQHNKPSGVIT